MYDLVTLPNRPANTLRRSRVMADLRSENQKAVEYKKECTFLERVPLETRLAIYSLVHAQSLDHYPPGSNWNAVVQYKDWRDLSLTCHQIRQEFLPFMMNIKYCKFSMSHLISFAEKGSRFPYLMDLIQNLYFKFDASNLPVDAASILLLKDWSPPVPWRCSSGPQGPFPTVSPDFEVAGIVTRLQLAMNHLDLVKSLTLDGRMDSSMQRQADTLLDAFMVALPNLSTLKIHMSGFPLSSLSLHANLQHLEFSGRGSSTTPGELLAVLKSLKNLKSISLIDPTTNSNKPGRKPPILFIPETLAQLNPLKSLSINNAYFLKPKMIKALHAHLKSLRTLSIMVPDTPDTEYDIVRLLEFVRISQLEDLTMCLRVSRKYRDNGIGFRSYLPRTPKNRFVFKYSMDIAPCVAPIPSLQKRWDSAYTDRLPIIWKTLPKFEGCVDVLEAEIQKEIRAKEAEWAEWTATEHHEEPDNRHDSTTATIGLKDSNARHSVKDKRSLWKKVRGCWFRRRISGGRSVCDIQ